MQLFRLLILAICFLAPLAQAAERTKARLFLSASSVRPGDQITAGVELQMPPRWHTYWRFGGDSGAPSKIQWQLPPGITAGEVLWPVPEKFVAEGLTTYVYHNTVVLLVPLKISDSIAPGPQNIKAVVSWLECEDVCLPGKADVEASFAVATASAPSADAALIETWTKRLPLTDHALKVEAGWDGLPTEDTRPLIITWEDKAKAHEADFYPYGSDDIEIAGATDRLSGSDGKVILRKQVKKVGERWPSQIQGLIVVKSSAESEPQGFEVTLALAEPTAIAGALNAGANAPGSGSSKKSLWAMLGLAFLGGLILNIMPCVLPVIALKILGFVNQSKEEPRRVRNLGFVYALGVVASFLVLAGIVIAVQQAGRAASWGMQFQNPQFLIGMTVLVTLVALNLFGLFEVNLSGRAMGAAGALASKEGAAGAFFNGVLATALATPCTAPFLGVALGFAFAQPAPIIVLMFVTVGLGLAAPYVILSWNPGWLRFLPKPGMWMERFKVAMGFPMLATAIWLFWLASGHFGRSGTLWLALFLVVLAMAAWVWGEFVQRGMRHRGLAIVVSALLLGAGYVYALEKQLHWRAPVRVAAASGGEIADPNGIAWKPWSAKAVEEARAAGHPVLVDFTADWCLTCQVNKKTSLEIASVRAKLKEIGAVAFLGDHTPVDPAITAELNKYERAGVPLVLVFPPNPAEPPVVLPEVLTPGIVLEALEKVARNPLSARSGGS